MNKKAGFGVSSMTDRLKTVGMLKPMDALRTADPVPFKIPIPLVAPVIPVFETVPAAAPKAIPPAEVAAPPVVPVINEHL